MAIDGHQSRKESLRRIMRSPVSLTTALLLILATGINAFAVDTTPGDSGIIRACVPASGIPRMNSGWGACRSGEKALYWTVKGKVGATGPQGDVGPTGPPGTNGIDVPWSNTSLTLTTSSRTIARNYLVTVTDGGYVELMWSSADAAMQLAFSPAGSGPTRPEVPSLYVTATRVG